ncbi:MAG TPA: kynureninase [Bacillota bacterium]|nr:kynureninase [Bacillota bacterium]
MAAHDPSELDARDPLPAGPGRFLLPPGTIYLDGNSLGPPTPRGLALCRQVLDDWERLGVAGWTDADPAWFTWAERLAAREARLLLGAQPSEVAVTGGTTINLHQLLSTFYRPSGRRRKLVADALAFPSDLYAMRAHAGDDLVLVPSRDQRTIASEDVEAALGDDVALVLLSGVLYRSGQLLDVARLTQAAHAAGALAGWDFCHAIGIVPLDLDAWGVDFAVWCNYKYLGAGPGAVGGLFVAERHLATAGPALPGWWGSDKARQFDMSDDFQPAGDAGAFQIGTPPILGLAALDGALDVYEEAGMAAVRARSLRLTAHLRERVEAVGLAVVTPPEDAARGGHIAVAHPEAVRVGRALRDAGVVPDVRPPDIVRLAPHPLYTTYADVAAAADALAAVVAERRWERYPAARAAVT